MHTLLIKETNRLQALKTEIEKFGAKVYIDKDSINISKSQNLKDNVKIELIKNAKNSKIYKTFLEKFKDANLIDVFKKDEK